MPGVRWIGKVISPSLFFAWIRAVAHLSFHLYPADRRRVQYLREALQGSRDDRAIRDICRRNLIYRKWLRFLVRAWRNWADQLNEWVSVEGELYLEETLKKGRGAVLLSGHAFGFAAFVSPVLTQKGFPIYRTGRGQRADQITRWGQGAGYVLWNHINYGESRWSHLQALNLMREALKQNSIVHASVKGYPSGDPRTRIDFCYQGFFLDPRMLRIIELLKAPVLPCFVVCDDKGLLTLRIYPPLNPNIDHIMREFGPLYARYLEQSPEYSRIWRRVVQRQEGW